MDQIIIQDLEVFYRIGVPEMERAQPQRLLVSVILDLDFQAAAKNDDLLRTINYFEVCQRVLNFGLDREWRLLETLSCELSTMILNQFSPAKVGIEIKKFIIPEARYISVKMVRSSASKGE